MKFLFVLATLVISASASAEIKVIQVTNGKAIIKFDPSDAITTSSTLVLKDLVLPNTESEVVSETPVASPVRIEVKPEYNRNHLITGFLESSSQDVTVKSGTSSSKTEVKITELDASYYYNLKNFALGFTIFNKKESYDGFEDLSTTLGLGAKYFFVENVAKNKAIPYAGIEFASARSDLYDTPRVETELSGTLINLGVLVFLADAAFIDIGYSFGTVDGDISQGSNIIQAESEGGGLSVGVGIALE